MSRPKGSIIGARPTWTTTATSGIWTLRQAEEMQADGQWPRGPVAPTSLAGTGSDGQVALTWTAPATTHGTITDYLVEYTAAGDPFFSSVSLLAPLDSDTTSVVGGVTPTVSGTAMTISPSDGKYGGYATNTVSTSTTTYSTSFGNGDWTVECWIRRDSFFETNPRIIDLGAVELEPGTSSTINFYYRPTDTNFSSSTFLTTQGQWHHVAIVYQSGVLRSYVDGVQRGSLTQAVTPPTSVQLTNTCSFDDLRVTAAAVYPDGTTFTPPTSAHATSGSGSPTVVATGSTAASYTLTGLTNYTEYTIRVAAVNHTRGDWSDSVAVTPSNGGGGINGDNRFRVTAPAATTDLTAGVETTTGYWKMVASTGQESAVIGSELSQYSIYYHLLGTVSGMPSGSEKTVEIFSCDASGNPSGELEYVSFATSSQSITRVDASGCTSLRGFRVSSSTAPSGSWSGSSSLPATLESVRAVGVAGSSGFYMQYNAQYPAIVTEGINVEGQALDAAALDQLYTDLAAGTNSAQIFVGGNPGTAGDDPTIATAKGYTVFGS